VAGSVTTTSTGNSIVNGGVADGGLSSLDSISGAESVTVALIDDRAVQKSSSESENEDDEDDSQQPSAVRPILPLPVCR